jgi:hypothetical protein
MSFNEASTYSQAQANSAATSFVPALDLIEMIKDALDQERWNARPVIRNVQGQSGPFFLSSLAHTSLKNCYEISYIWMALFISCFTAYHVYLGYILFCLPAYLALVTTYDDVQQEG